MHERLRRMAHVMGVSDPKGAIDRFYARRRVGRSRMSPECEQIVGPLRPTTASKRIVFDDTPKGEPPVWGYLGIVATEPVTYKGSLVMWSPEDNIYIALREPERPTLWKRLRAIVA